MLALRLPLNRLWVTVKGIRFTQDIVMMLVLSVVLAILSTVTILLIREVDENQVQVERFANYMRCLIVPNEARYEELGREAYVRECENLL